VSTSPFGRSATRTRWTFAFGFVVIAVAGVALGLRVVFGGYSPVPFADFWSQFDFIAQSLDGNVGVGDFWAQHNEHRIVLARLQFLVDYGLFDGTNVFLFASIVASSIALAATYAATVYFETRDWLFVLGTFAVGAASTMSPAGWENLTWAFQVQFVQAFLFPAVSVLAVVLAARSPHAGRSALLTTASGIAAIAATYSMANGFFIWPVVVGLALLLRLSRRQTAVLAFVGLATVASYFWHLEFSTRGELSDPVGLFVFVAAYLGSAVGGAGLPEATLVGVVGLLLLPVLYALAWRRRIGSSIALHVGAGIATFVLLTAAQTAGGRLYLGTSQAISSRYSIASFTFWLALVVAFLTPVRERWRAYPSAGLAYLACAALAALFVGYRSVPDADYLRTVVFGKEATVLTFRVGVNDDSQTVTGVAAGDSVSNHLRWMELERLGPWAPGGMVDATRMAGRVGATTRDCLGAVESNQPVDRGRRLHGWIESPAGDPASRTLVVLGSDEEPAGLGLVGAPRDIDAPGPVAEWSGFVAYVAGEPAAPLSVVLLDDDGRAALCRLVAPVGG
jgi:hypothetical protein